MWKAGNGRTLHTHTYTHFPALCPLNTGVFTFNSKQQQQPAAFPTAPSITRQSLTRVFQWLLCEHWTQKRFPALGSSCPRYRWLSGHSDKAWLCITSSHSASLPNSHGKAIRARGRKGWDQGCREPAELQLYYGLHQSGGQVTAWFRCVGQSRPRVCRKPAKTGKVISLVTATNWNHDVRGAGTGALLINDRVAPAEQTNPTSQSRSLPALSLEVSQPEGIIPSDIASLLRFPGQALNTSKTDASSGQPVFFKGAW